MNISEYVSGKVILTGEWGVLEFGNPCVVLPFDKGVIASIFPAKTIIVDAADVGLCAINLSFEKSALRIISNLSDVDRITFLFVFHAIEVACTYLHECGVCILPFYLSIKSAISGIKKNDGTVVKGGFGSSAATVVAIIKIILRFHGVDLEDESFKKNIFSLSCIAHYFAQGCAGSGADVAAAVYGCPVTYRRFDESWLLNQLARKKNISEIVHAAWLGLEISPVKIPNSMRVCVGFVGYSASTKKLIERMLQFKKAHKKSYDQLVTHLADGVKEVSIALRDGDQRNILLHIKRQRERLKALATHSSIDLETSELALLCDIAEQCGGAAKFSGAGGGDCGIAVCFDDIVAAKIMNAWEQNNIQPISVLKVA